jgi:hypothetical protein
MGYSKSSFRGRGRIYKIILLYSADSQVHEFWDNWYDNNQIESLLLDNNYKFLGNEKYSFKIWWLFLRKYKYT